MAYDNAIRETYSQPSTAFGATTESSQHIGPKGRVGWVRDIEVYLTAAAVGTTSVPEIAVGSAQGLSEYGRFRLGTTVVAGYPTTAPGPVYRASQVAGDTWGDSVLEDYVGHVKMATIRIPADTVFFISRVAGIGTPAGTGTSRVIIDWV